MAAAGSDGTFKTEICKRWLIGCCSYGGNCQFAHGAQDLRQRERHERYKTVLCRGFIESGGHCRYGSRCHYIHAFSLPDTTLTLSTMVNTGVRIRSGSSTPPPTPLDLGAKFAQVSLNTATSPRESWAEHHSMALHSFTGQQAQPLSPQVPLQHCAPSAMTLPQPWHPPMPPLPPPAGGVSSRTDAHCCKRVPHVQTSVSRCSVSDKPTPNADEESALHLLQQTAVSTFMTVLRDYA